MKLQRLVVAAMSAGALALPPSAASAGSLPLACGSSGGLTVCSGVVPSWDGSPLDTDLTLPAGGGSSHPLMVMLHGFGNDKHEWESGSDEGDGADKWHWNSHWFATHGYYVLTYTARGFRNSYLEPSGVIRLKSKEFEIRDTQWLSQLVARAYPDLDRERVAVTGGSYGGGESWTLASQPTWHPVLPGLGLPELQLQVAVPKYPWTDLGYSLAPNGHPNPLTGSVYDSATGSNTDPKALGAPIGVPKASYVTGFYALGSARGGFQKATSPGGQEAVEDGPIDLNAWSARVMVTGDPYDAGGAEDPIVRQVRRGLTVYRSAYYQPDAWKAQVGGREVAVASISGWTDDLFPPVESFRMFDYLKSLDRLWPVEVMTADIGHPRAQNPPAEWHRLNDLANAFLAEQIHGSHRQQTGVRSLPTVCGGDGAAGELKAQTPQELGSGRLTVGYTRPGATASPSGSADPNGPATDPVLSSQALGLIIPGPNCREAAGPAVGGYTAVSDALPAPQTMVGIGTVKVSYVLVGSEASLDARLWDVAPDGKTLLVTRGAYRIDVPAYNQASQTIEVPFFGNHWTFEAGHRIRLDLTQADSPTFRASSAPSALTFGPPVVELPVRGSSQELSGT